MQPVSVCVVHCSQITVTTVEEIDVLKEEVMSSPVLLRVWAEFIDNDYIGAAHLGPRFEGIRWAVERFDYSLGRDVSLNTWMHVRGNALRLAIAPQFFLLLFTARILYVYSNKR